MNERERIVLEIVVELWLASDKEKARLLDKVQTLAEENAKITGAVPVIPAADPEPDRTGPCWVPCPGLCGEFWCIRHQSHASECDCPPAEEWTESPYLAGCP